MATATNDIDRLYAIVIPPLVSCRASTELKKPLGSVVAEVWIEVNFDEFGRVTHDGTAVGHRIVDRDRALT
jgi:hypothetical protein